MGTQDWQKALISIWLIALGGAIMMRIIMGMVTRAGNDPFPRLLWRVMMVGVMGVSVTMSLAIIVTK